MEDRKNEENILIETNLETGEEKEVIVESNPNDVLRYSPARITIPKFNELTGGSASQPFATNNAWSPMPVVELNYFNPLCYISVTMDNGETWQGSAFIVGERTLVTAGHCVEDIRDGKLRKAVKVTVIPKKQGNKNHYGVFETTKMAIPKKWSESKDPNYDYGILTMNTNIEKIVGSKFGYRDTTNIALQGKTITAIGYPGYSNGKQYIDSGTITEVNAKTLKHQARTDRGQSGGPAYLNKGVVDGINI